MMATNCEDVSAQMMELLYGELPADARASVDAHVAGCARCRAELDGFEKTRALARRGLDEAPPARARAAILQAAAAHLAAQAQPAAAARRPATPEKTSFWDRLRARWTFPTLATIGAVAVFLVANRVFLNPERTLESRPAAEAPVVTSAPAPAAEPKAAEPRWAGESPKMEDDERTADRLDRRRGPGDGASRGSHHGKSGGGRAEEKAKADRDLPYENKFAPPPPPRENEPAIRDAKGADKAATPRKELREEAQAQAPRMDTSRSAAAAPARKQALPRVASAEAPAQAMDDLLGGSAGKARGGEGVVKGKPAVGGLAGPGSKADGYGSGAGAAQPAPAAPRPAPVAGIAPPATASAPPAPQSPPVALTKSRAKKSSEPADEEAYEGAPEASAAKDEKKAVAAKNTTNDAILLRADRLFAEGRWAEAAALYRELLKRDPRNDDAERWRRRLVAAENAEVTERRNASVAAKRAAAPSQEKAEAESAARAAKPAAKAAKAKASAVDSAQ